MSGIAVHETKRLLRKELKRRIAALSVEEREKQSEYVVNRLISHPVYKSSQRISVYLPMVHEEINTEGGLDLIIMPGLGFSKDGDRLGRGKGYYDKYLRRCSECQSGMPKTIAVAFKEQIQASIPTTESDQKVDHVLFGYMDEG